MLKTAAPFIAMAVFGSLALLRPQWFTTPQVRLSFLVGGLLFFLAYAIAVPATRYQSLFFAALALGLIIKDRQQTPAPGRLRT
jgi:hypothetical protein